MLFDQEFGLSWSSMRFVAGEKSYVFSFLRQQRTTRMRFKGEYDVLLMNIVPIRPTIP